MCVPVGVAAGFAFGGAIGGTLGWRWAFAFEAAARRRPSSRSACRVAPDPHARRGRGRGARMGAPTEVPPTEVSPTSTLDLHPPSTPTPRRLSRSRARSRGTRRRCFAAGRFPRRARIRLLHRRHRRLRRVGSKGGLRRVRRESPLPRAIGRGVRGRDGGGGRDGNRTRRRRRGFRRRLRRRRGARVCALATLLAFALLECAFAAASFPAFVALFTAGETLAFVAQAPVNAIVLWSVPPGARPLRAASPPSSFTSWAACPRAAVRRGSAERGAREGGRRCRAGARGLEKDTRGVHRRNARGGGDFRGDGGGGEGGGARRERRTGGGRGGVAAVEGRGEGRKTCSAREGGTPTWHTRP